MKKDDFEHPTLQIVDHGHSLDKEFMFDTEGKKDDISTRHPESLPHVTTKAPKKLSSMQNTHTNKTMYFPSIEFKCSNLETYIEVLDDFFPPRIAGLVQVVFFYTFFSLHRFSLYFSQSQWGPYS